MKVLLPLDGSAEAGRAQELVASIAWPERTCIEILTVGPAFDERPDTYTHRYDVLYTAVHEAVATMLAKAERDLAGAGREVTTQILFGRPASLILEEAQRAPADVIVMGSRGRGPIASALLGSVSAEVVDHAPCPVLIARRPTLRALVLAADGSDGAREAEEVVAGWPFLASVPVTVVSVADLLPVFTALDASGTGVVDAAVYQQLSDDLRAVHERLAAEAAERLRKRGVAAQARVRYGAPAAELIQAARDTAADVIVTGTRGRTGLTRLVLGSVARSVLVQSPVSVLTVRSSVRMH